MTRFRARLEPVSHGGLYAPVSAAVAKRAGLKTRDRVRGTVNGVPFRSSLAKYADGFHLGVPLEALKEVRKGLGDTVTLAIALDDEPLVVPPDLARALKAAKLRPAFDGLSPSRRYVHAKSVSDAKKPQTRARRVAGVLAALRG